MMQAIGLSFCLAFLNVFLRISVHEWHVQPIIFTCVCLMTAAMVLSLVGGPGRLTTATLKSAATWVYSFLLMAAYVTDVYIMQFLSATEASFYSRLTIPLALVAAWFLHKRLPRCKDMIGLGIIGLALLWLTFLQPVEMLLAILAIVILGAFIQTALVVIAETHKESVAAAETGTFRDRARVVGFVTFVSSAAFLCVSLFLSFLFTAQGWDTSITYGLVPDVALFVHPPTVAAALFYGVLILPLIRYLKWGASYNLKAENLLVVMSFIPVMTLLLEFLVGQVMAFPANADVFKGVRGQQLLAIAVLITFGAALTTIMRVYDQLKALPKKTTLWTAIKTAMKPPKNVAIEYSDTAMDDYDTVTSTLEFAKGDAQMAANLLDIPESTLTVIKEGKGSLALIQSESKKIARRYRSNVATRDSLTGLLNRGAFMVAAREEQDSGHSYSILFIDLDKFKPVNDTYGHEAGDFVLKGVAERLAASTASNAYITRLGGDEFALLLPGATKQQSRKQAETIKAALGKAFQFDGKKITIGCSVGIASYPDDGSTPEQLLDAADKAMYGVKHSTGDA